MSIYGSENGIEIIPGEIGSNATTQNADNSGNTVMPPTAFDPADPNAPVGDTRDNYVMPKPYTAYSSGYFDTKPFTDAAGKVDWAKLAVAMGGIAGAANASKGNQGGAGSGYQGGIPTLYAGRNMMSAPPTMVDGKKRRPGSGGIDYGGDVTYFNTKAEVDAQKAADAAKTGLAAIAPPVVPPVVPPANLGSKGYQAFIAAGKTPAEYLKAINQWIIDNPNATKAERDAAMKKYNVTEEDLQAALTSSQFSDATKYFMTQGKDGLKELNTNILKWVKDNPNATKQQVADIIKASGVDTRDLGRAFGTEENLSKAKEYALTHGMSLDYFNDIINNYMGTKPKAEDAKKFLDTYGITEADVQEAAKYTAPPAAGVAVEEPSVTAVQDWLKTNKGASDEEIARAMKTFNVDDDLLAEATGLSADKIAARRKAVGYADGGMAQGRYLQGGTDGMADELPAKIGADQPAALSHGEFVVPADVVSHLGNGNSDAGAKKLYQMMDKIRMARTGNKKQGKKINPDKFMPGGLAAAYAAGGSVQGYAGPTGSLVGAGVTGTESNLSNWAGPYVTDMLGKGKALSEMPYKAYTGPLTAGQSDLQSKVSTGLQGLTFPGNLGKSFTSTDAPTIGADGKPVGGGGIASQYMNPYLDSVLNPQLDELQRRSQINLQPDMAKLTKAGGFGGSRQALMMGESGRNLLQEQNKTVGQGYATAFDKGMQQFNTEQGQSRGLVDLMTNVGATDRAIDAEGIAADKTQFEEARANPYKMLQFQQSLLQGMPLDSQAYNTSPESQLVSAAKGAKTVDELLKVLGLTGLK